MMLISFIRALFHLCFAIFAGYVVNYVFDGTVDRNLVAITYLSGIVFNLVHTQHIFLMEILTNPEKVSEIATQYKNNMGNNNGK